MEDSGGSHSTSYTLQDRTTSKLSLDGTSPTSTLETVEALTSPLRRSTWVSRQWGRLSVSHPRAHRLLNKIGIYVRGPRPKQDLLDVAPFLNIDISFRGQRLVLPIESRVLTFTKPLTNKWLLLVLGAAYIIGLAFFARAQFFLTPAESFVGCTSTFWLANNGCGADGQQCAPFSNSTFDFRCPAQCNSVILQNPRTIGDEQVAFVPLIVGGGDSNHTYRGDSFICAAATQAGIISNSRGGCGSLALTGNFTEFLPLVANGLTSIGFDTVFPLSFRFLGSTPLSHCDDMRDDALAFNILITCLLFVVLRPKPIILYWCLVCIGFWHVVLFSQPQGPPPPLDIAFGSFLPALFIAYAFWRLAFRFVFPVFSKIPLEGCILYLGTFWVGVLSNLIFDKIPISRLTSSDLHKRSGAIAALLIIILVVFVIAVNQVRVIRKTGWLPFYLKWYILGGLVVLVLALLPGLQLRVHHYITAMVLIPGTAFPTRLSAMYQGLLLGMFLNGGAAFGFDSILQTGADLRQDAPLGSALPTFLTNSMNYNSSIPFADQIIFWDALPSDWDGFALLVDDVQRFAGTALNFSLVALDVTLPHFFRLAFTSGSSTADFTKAATLWPNGTWVDPLPGPS